jgi:hypothetical protein
MLPDTDCSVSGLRDEGYEQWCDDVDAQRNASDLYSMDEEDYTAYAMSEDSYIPFDPPQAA